MITRFAPSPTGYLHLGHALAAKTAFEFGGTCLLRIEDIDHTRCRPDFTKQIYEDLRWLGFSWPEPARIQSEHLCDYADVLDSLKDRGLVYSCFKSRKDLPSGVYHGPEVPLSASEEQAYIAEGQRPAWRLNMAKARKHIGTLSYQETGLDKGRKLVNPEDYGDVVLARKDIGTSYLIACTHDDALQGISDVVRGADFIHLTGMQRILQALMGWPEPNYHHHALLKNAAGDKLAKRNKDTAIYELRAKGLSPRGVLDMASQAPAG